MGEALPIIIVVAAVAFVASVLVAGWTWNPCCPGSQARTPRTRRGIRLLLGALAGSLVALVGYAASQPLLGVVGGAMLVGFAYRYVRLATGGRGMS